MSTYKSRVVEEREELMAKLERLHSFINSAHFNGVLVAEQLRLKRQASVMEEYIGILRERIEAF